MSVENVVALDAGSHSFKAGLAVNFPNEGEPGVVTPSAVRDESTVSLGKEIRAVEGGTVVNWDAYEAILDDILYSQLGWTIGDEGAILAGEALFTSRAEREQLTQLLFEHNNVAGFFMCDQPVLSLYAVGKLSGCVADIGHTKTDIAAVSEGQLFVPSARRLPFGMQTVSQHLGRILKDQGAELRDTAALDILRTTILRVADSGEEARDLISKGTHAPGQHTLPDGQTISFGGEGVELGEALLDGSRMAIDTPPTAEAVYNACVGNPDPAVRKGMLESLLVCGGGSSAPGLSLRLLRELRGLLPPSASPALVQPLEYTPPNTLRFSAWTGAAVLSKVVFQQNQQVNKFDYDEVGPAVIHRKCC